MMATVQHIAMSSRDRLRAEAFWTEHFGFRRVRTFNAGTPNEFVMLRLGPVCLELFQAKEAEATGGEQPVGFKHLAFEVEDLEAAVSKLRADGIEPERIIDCSAVSPGMRVCFFNDADGNRIELMENYRDEE
jgi:glyoxylase I family protein